MPIPADFAQYKKTHSKSTSGSRFGPCNSFNCLDHFKDVYDDDDDSDG